MPADETGRSLPDDLEPLLASVFRIFAAEGKATEVAILANAKPFIEETDSDNWNGSYGYRVTLAIPAHLDAQITPKKAAIQKSILQKIGEQSRSYAQQYVASVTIMTEIRADPEWRNEAKQWLSGQGISNQGRVRSDNVASRQYDGLLFRSEPEILLYKALKSAGVSFAPLPVFIRGGDSYRRIEPDFVILKDGIVLVVEVDGDTVHHETPVEAHSRTTMMLHEGAHVERVRAAECNSLEAAEFVAEKLLRVIAKIKMSR